MLCPNCKKTLNDDAKFCCYCGKAVPRCPSCGRVLTKKTPFCAADGTPIPEEILSLIPDENQEREGSEAPSPSRGGFCVKCGQPCKPGERVCDKCRGIGRPEETKPQNRTENSRNGILPLVIIIAVLLAVLVGMGAYACTAYLLPVNQGPVGPRNSSEEPAPNREEKETEEEAEEAEEAATEETTLAETTVRITVPEVVTEAPTEATTLSDIEYFIVNSDKRYFSESYFADFDANMCRLARNGIYAYAGRGFKDSSLQIYFEQYDWYNPTIAPDDFRETMLNEYQIANRDLIVSYEDKKGY
ncbi:MAG: YARHG domain-containing protein [Clostridiales bacterium]|nr:YARHG domain-containing protein [Clostridiales bacterium]